MDEIKRASLLMAEKLIAVHPKEFTQPIGNENGVDNTILFLVKAKGKPQGFVGPFQFRYSHSYLRLGRGHVITAAG